MTLDMYEKLKAGFVPEGWDAKMVADKIAEFEANAPAHFAKAE